jgi:hypothetical protein
MYEATSKKTSEVHISDHTVGNEFILIYTTRELSEQLCGSSSGKRHQYPVTSITFISSEFKYDVYETSVDNVLTILFIEGQVNLIQIY